MVTYDLLNHSIGTFCIKEENGNIVAIFYYKGEKDFVPEKENRHEKTALTAKAKEQLLEYLSGNRTSFDLPLNPKGTDFQKRVWKALCNIPYGTTKSYGQIAKEVGSPKGARAVGMACNRNPIVIVVPCHRVIGSNHKLVGFAGGLDVKEFLLHIENSSQTWKI